MEVDTTEQCDSYAPTKFFVIASLTSLVADYTAASEMQPLHQPALSTAVQRLAEGRPDRIEYPPDELPSILNPNQVIAC